ncbi:acetate/propionate family kinase [Actimicrobium antarcticum]|uniref:Acetate kinase n=1 Tax=Actimicrobium antarcticum TaxID=1051899 RepID=A0ABP7SS88_9BURK
MVILSINAGSSTLKFGVHDIEHGIAQPAALTGSIEGLEPGGHLSLSWRSGGQVHREQPDVDGHAEPFHVALQTLQRLLQEQRAGRTLQAIAHRVVHGGASFRQAVKVDAAILHTLSDLAPLAPLHQPHNIDGILALGRAFPDVPQIACFDTAFHADLPEEEYLFALPQALGQQGIRRYGFHGLSYQSVSQTLARFSQRAAGRVVMAHLGNGASLCGMLDGKSRATTMGFSALDGLMMGTRCGAIDAGVLLHLLAQGWDHARLEALLYRQSGLLGVSGISADMRQLRASDDPNAQLAIRLFGYRVVRETAAVAACIGGLDALVFTGGIGEHDQLLRADVCDRLAFLGVALDHDKNSTADGTQVVPVHSKSSQAEVWVIPTDEARMAAQIAADLLRQ